MQLLLHVLKNDQSGVVLSRTELYTRAVQMMLQAEAFRARLQGIGLKQGAVRRGCGRLVFGVRGLRVLVSLVVCVRPSCSFFAHRRCRAAGQLVAGHASLRGVLEPLPARAVASVGQVRGLGRRRGCVAAPGGARHVAAARVAPRAGPGVVAVVSACSRRACWCRSLVGHRNFGRSFARGARGGPIRTFVVPGVLGSGLPLHGLDGDREGL